MEEIYNIAVQKRKEHELLYHYTNEESLKIIMNNNSLRLSRLDIVNDPDEAKRIKSLWNQKIFAACFTNTKENESYMRKYYGNVRITFKASNMEDVAVYADSECSMKMEHLDRSNIEYKKYGDIADWGYFDISFADVIYVNSLDDYSNGITEYNAGLIKAKRGADINGEIRDWTSESETRIRVAVRPIGVEWSKIGYGDTEYYKPSFKYLYVDIKDKIMNIERL